MKYILTFSSVYFVTKAEKILKSPKFSIRLIPTPRNISSDCGMAIEVFTDNVNKVKKLLEENKCDMIGIYDNKGVLLQN